MTYHTTVLGQTTHTENVSSVQHPLLDCVQHPLLLDKLSALNVGETTVQWAEDYLAERKQRVLANDVCSSYLKVTQGVPQGSVLGPLFYIIYANDLTKCVVDCEMALYADDTVLYTAQNNFDHSVRKLQGDLDRLSLWCAANGIKMNTSKTKVMVFGSNCMIKKLPDFEITCDGVPLQKVASYKYLGITLDSQLNFNMHVNNIIGSVSNKLKQFQRMRSFLSVKAAVLVYKGMLLPILEYGDIFLSATTVENRKKLQTLQNKGLRCALNKGIEYSSIELHNEANLLKLVYRWEQHLLNFMYDYAQQAVNCRLSPSMSIKTRSQNKKLLKVKRPYSEKFKKSLAYFGPKKWNLLPESFGHSISKVTFKNLVEGWVKNKSEASNTTLTGSPNGTHMGWMWASGQGFTHLGPKWDPQGKPPFNQF